MEATGFFSEELAKHLTKSVMSMSIYPYKGTWGPAMKKGDRVRIKDGYDNAGVVGFYEAKSNDEEGKSVVMIRDVANILLTEAIEPYPYSREERIERAIEDYEEVLRCEFDTQPLIDFDRAILYAIIDAGI